MILNFFEEDSDTREKGVVKKLNFEIEGGGLGV